MALDIPPPKKNPVVVWNNPDCSKCRKLVAMLESLEWPEIVLRNYLDEPPTAEELNEVLGKLGKGPREIIRTGEAAYDARGLSDPDLPDAELVAAMAAEPILIQRPIVICGNRAAIGRPNYRALEVLAPEGELPPMHELMKSDIKEKGI